MAASTVLDVITDALTAIGQLGQGQTPNASDANRGLRKANLILSRASAKRLFLTSVSQRTYNLQANLSDYTIGQTGGETFNEAPPTFIESCQVNIPGSSYWAPVTILDKAGFDAIPNRAAIDEVIASIYPEYRAAQVAFHVHPKPLGAPAIRMGTWELIAQFATVMDPINLRTAYEDWLLWELVVVLAPDYDQPLPDGAKENLVDARQTVMQLNAQPIGGAISAAQALQSPNVGQPPGASQ